MVLSRDDKKRDSGNAAAVAIFFFFCAVVYTRLCVQLASKTASRKIMRAIEICCSRKPVETVSFVLAPCLLPAPLFNTSRPGSLSATPLIHSDVDVITKRHLYELVNRVIRQDLLPAACVDNLFEIIFSLAYSCDSHIDVDISRILFCDMHLCGNVTTSVKANVGIEFDPWGWKQGGCSSMILGLILRAVSSEFVHLTLEDCQDRVNNIEDLLLCNVKSDLDCAVTSCTFKISQPSMPLLQMDCMKCVSSLLNPLLSKKILTSQPLQMLLHRLDEASVQHTTVAQSPLLANILHALVIANKNSGYRILNDSLEELESILARSPKSVVARNALLEVKKHYERRKQL